jgi:hypothetical protein
VTVAVIVLGLLVLLLAGMRTSSPVELAVEASALRIRFTGKDALYALSRGIAVPLTAVRAVSAVPNRDVQRTGLRLPGTNLPGVLRAGSYGTGSRRDLWLVRRAPARLVIELQPGQRYRRVVLQVPDPQGEAARLRAAIVAPSPS